MCGLNRERTGYACYACNGTGNCPVCNGTGKNPYNKGNKCPPYKGSGKCTSSLISIKKSDNKQKAIL